MLTTTPTQLFMLTPGIRYGLVALLFTFIGMVIGFKRSHVREALDLVAVCTTNQHAAVLLAETYRETTHQCLDPFNAEHHK